MGKSLHLNCYVCQKYLELDGETAYKQTMFRCYDGKMPLADCSDPTIGRDKSCVDEHLESQCKVVGCFGDDRQYNIFSKEKQVQLVSRWRTRYNRVREAV